MSERPFEDFVVDHFFTNARDNIISGHKYQFRSPNKDNSLKLFRAFTKRASGTGFIDLNSLKLIYLECANVKIIPILHKDGEGPGYTENFISFLRDEVSGQKGDFHNTALLIIHNSMLDTLINSSKDINGQGEVFDPERIKLSLSAYIDENDAVDAKEISKILLDYQYELIIEDKASMFGFKALHDAIRDGDIRFNEIELLDDPAILNMRGNNNQIKERLNKNRELYDHIDQIVQHYPDQLEDHLTDFSNDFINKHFRMDEDPDSWKNVTLDEFLQEQERNRTQELVLINELSATGEVIVRAKGDTKAARRDRHIIIEVPDNRDDFDLAISFIGARVSKSEATLETPKDNLATPTVEVSGGSKNTTITATGKIGVTPEYFGISLKRAKPSECYKFRCMVIKKGLFNIESIKNSFLINPRKKVITLQTQETELYIGVIENLQKITNLTDLDQTFDVQDHGWLNYEEISNEVERISFSVANESAMLTFDVEGAAATDNLILPLIFNLDIGKRLFTAPTYGVLNKTKQRVYVEHKEVKVNKPVMEFLTIEADWIENKIVSRFPSEAFTITDLSNIAPGLASAYSSLYKYLIGMNTLPSLSGWGTDFRMLVEKLVVEYFNCITEFEINQFLGEQEARLIHLGLARRDEEEWITPFHPLVLAYYLELTKRAATEEDDSYFSLPGVTLARLNPQGLLPYVFHPEHGFSYVQASEDNSMWLQMVPQPESDYSYIRKLFREKVREFSDAFECLFPKLKGDARPTLIINSVNNYDNHGIFEGIVDHLIKSQKETFNIHVNIYDDVFDHTEFDIFSSMSNYEEIKQRYGLNRGKIKDIADTIVDLLRTRVTYSKYIHSKSERQEYAHLCFFRNNEKVEVISVDPEDRLSGICSNGLINGEASSNNNGVYITGFGTQSIKTNENIAVSLAKVYGRLFKPSLKSTFEYRDNSAIALAVNERFKTQLERCYESSIWTSIIDPKVTLDFFESSINLLLIHYSDQYTSSASYDAITVTRQTELYHKVLEKDEGGLVSEFNAFNGEWLLKLITDNENLRKEKKGILAAYKLVNILLSHTQICWVPISAAELVRVSGNIGLRVSESEFSRYVHGFKSGPISDDVLFVGFDNCKLYLMPLEVKTGANYDSIKAVRQATELSNYMMSILDGNGIAKNIYRGLFVRQVIMQVEKYLLYDVYPENYFKNLLVNKEWWLQGEYIVGKLPSYAKGIVVANLERSQCISTSAEMVEDILKIEVPSSFIRHTISTPLTSLLTDHCGTAAAVMDKRYFLTNASSYLEPEITSKQVTKTDLPASFGVAINDEPLHPPKTSSETLPAENTEFTENENLKVLVGHDVDHGNPVLWEPTNTAKFMNTNSGIIGTMGTGKTQCTKSVVTQLYKNQDCNVDGKPIGVLIFDYKSDYVDDKFINATDAKKFKLFKLPYNPLSLFGDTPMLPVHTAAGFSETMAKAYGLGKKQQLALENVIFQCYENSGICPENPSTWSKPAPTIEDVWQQYLESEPDEDSLYAALSKLARFKIFEDNIQGLLSLYELVDGVTVIELAGYPPQVQNLVVALTLDLFYSQMQKQGKPSVKGDFRQVTKMILVDEADNFMSQDFPSLRKILKEGREYGVGVILSTQDITHFKTKDNDYSAYILSWVIHRVSQLKNNDIKALFNKDDRQEQEHLMKVIRELEKHFSLYVNGDKKVIKIRDKAFWELLNE